MYDLEFDELLIEQSLAKQYGILPAAQGELPYSEWAKLVSGLMDDTPLGRIVAVRMETDPKVIANFSPWQREARAKWRAFQGRKAKQSTTREQARKAADRLETMMAKLFGGGESG